MEIYLDESGNLGGLRANSSAFDPYFVLAALIVRDSLSIRRCIKDIRKKKLKKKYRKTSELKFKESDDTTKRRILECIGRTNNDIGYVVVSKAHLIESHQCEMVDSQTIYSDICKRLVYKIINDYGINGSIDIIIDRSLYGTQREKFDYYLANWTGMAVPSGLKEVRVSHVDSKRCPCIQAVDFVAGAVSRKYRDGEDLYYLMIQDKIAVRVDI
jgi:hypothetical protein